MSTECGCLTPGTAQGYDVAHNGSHPRICYQDKGSACQCFGGCYLPMDVCNLQFRDDSFPCVIDKGTMDALLCGRHYEVQVTKMIEEIGRVLAVHGIFIEITFGKNVERMGVFDCPELLPWTLESTIHVDSQGETVYICIFRKFQECVIQDVEKCFYLYGEDEESEEESD